MMRALLFIVLLGWLTPLLAQNDVINQQVLWTKLHIHWKINDHWTFDHGMDERTFIDPARRHMFLGSTEFVRKMGGNWSLLLDMQYARFTLPHNPEITSTIHRWEMRPTVGVNYSLPINEKWKFSNRVMLEIRYFRPINDDGTLDKSTYDYHSWRVRNRAMVSYSLTKKWTLHLMDEYMVHNGEETPTFFDQNRIGLTGHYRANQLLGLEAGYLNWFQRRGNPGEFFSRHSWRTILHLYF